MKKVSVEKKIQKQWEPRKDPTEIHVEIDAELLSLEDFIERTKPNEGLIASLKFEANKASEELKPRGLEEWDARFQLQANKVYE